MKPICIIPARSGSKRIKNKNIKTIDGLPILLITIKKLLKMNLFKRIIVTTDCNKIAKIAKKSGAEVPFIRQKKLSTDNVSVNEVLYDAIINSKTQNEPLHACVFSTSILIKRKIIFNAIKKINSSNYDNIIAIKKFENHPLKSLYLKKDKIYLNWKAKLQNTQEYKDLYHDAGYFYLFKTKNFVKTKKLLNNKTSYIKLLKNESIDIDTKDDFEIAKYIYKFNLSKNE